jgi:hypothetical protein
VLVGFCALGWLRMRFPKQLSGEGPSAIAPSSDSGSEPGKTTLGSSGLL